MEDVKSEEIFVIKRDGTKELLNLEKIHKVINWAVEGIEGVSVSDIEMHAKMNLSNGVKTSEIHEALVDSARNLISEESPNYQYVAANLLNYSLRKEVWGGKNPPSLKDFVKKNISKGLYTAELANWYTEEEFDKINEFLNHEGDFTLEYGALKKITEVYLVQDRVTGRLFETPQFMFILIAMTLFSRYEGKTRLKYIKQAYNFFLKKKINLPTPILVGARTPSYSWASCCLVEVGDTLESICASVTAATMATAGNYGMGIHMGNIRAMNAPIRGGETLHTGVVGFIQIMQAAILSTKRGGSRRGAGTISFPLFHYEIESLLELKNAGGTEENRARHLDYSISISKLFYDRWLKNEPITLFSYHEVPEIFDNFGMENFDELYLAAEKNKKLKFKKTVDARHLFSILVKERTETGRLYIYNIDLANKYSPWLNQCITSNLCQEIVQPISPFKSLHDQEGEIGVCVLAAVNMLNVKNDKEHEQICDVIVRMLDELIDIQSYFSVPASNFAINKRSLGVGITNLAGWLAHENLNYDSLEAPDALDEFMEKQQYFLMKASNQIAKEKGAAPHFNQTKYSQGKMPLDLYYAKAVDQFIKRTPTMPWEELKKDIAQYGLRNCTLSAQMPCETSSLVQSSTNGMEPVRSIVAYKKGKNSALPVIVPNSTKLKNNYQLAFDLPNNDGLLRVVATIQKWLCMACSTNLYYSKKEGSQNDVLLDIFKVYKYGIKTIYYSNTDDDDKQLTEIAPEQGCDSGSCSI